MARRTSSPDLVDAPVGWRRWVDGWGAGLVMVLIAGSALMLSWPRAIAPHHLPQPVVDQAALGATEGEDDRLATRAEGLDVDVRAVGSALRAYNLAAAEGDEAALFAQRTELANAARLALDRHGAEPLRVLRAYQMHLFLRSLHFWMEGAPPSEELWAIGGDFVQAAERQDWCRGGPRQLLASESVLRTLFKKRWNDVTGLTIDELALTIDEDRIRYGFLLAHPFRPHRRAGVDDPALEARRIARARLKILERLAARDPAYPAAFGQGVAFYQLGRYEDAATAFRRHLAGPDDAPYRTWAQNHLRASLEMAALP